VILQPCRLVAGALVMLSLLAVTSRPAAARIPQATPDLRLRIEVGVDPAVVTVGDRFHSYLRVVPPDGWSVHYEDVPATDSLQPIAAMAPAQDGVTAVYPLVAWVAGESLSASVAVRLVGPDGAELARSVALRLPEVVPVLPAEAAGLAPMPAKGLYVPPSLTSLPWWWWLIALLVLLAGSAALYRLVFVGDDPVAELPQDPRDWALARLGEARAQLGVRGPAPVVRDVAWIARTYLWQVRPELGPDLTTTEVRERMGGSGETAAAAALAEVLAGADRVKFARHLPSSPEAEHLVAAAMAWVASYPPPSAGEVRRSAA
jgi:hypothetical protein